MKRLFFISFTLLMLLPVLAAADNYYSVIVDEVQYSLLPGEEVDVRFTISNRELFYPKNVTAYIDPCPVGWECQRRTFSFSSEGQYPANLTVKVPKTAQPKKYTLYVLLESDYQTRRGYDRVVLDVITEKDVKAVSYDDYTRKEEEIVKEEQVVEVIDEPEKAEPEPVPEEVEVEESVSEPEENIVDTILPDINRTEIAENVERLESSSQFVEYASVVLIVVLVFIAAGAYLAFRKDK